MFNLTDSEISSRSVDLIDVVRDQDQNYVAEEDLTVYVSSKTSRGPLDKDWLKTFSQRCVGTSEGHAIMCAYALCKVDAGGWYCGMQSKIERFIHDNLVRNTMLRSYRQAWVWQDEWSGLTMDDIRDFERRTAEELKRKMRGEEEEDGDIEDAITEAGEDLGKSFNSIENSSGEVVNSPSLVTRPDRGQRRSLCLSESSVGSASAVRRNRVR